MKANKYDTGLFKKNTKTIVSGGGSSTLYYPGQTAWPSIRSACSSARYQTRNYKNIDRPKNHSLLLLAKLTNLSSEWKLGDFVD